MIRKHKDLADSSALKARIKAQLKKSPQARIKSHNLYDSGSFKAQRAVILALVESYGSQALLRQRLLESDERLVIPKHQLNEWVRDGFVPLHQVFYVARALGISEYLLNYKDVALLIGLAPTWGEALISLEGSVHPYKFAEIAKFAQPRIPKGVRHARI